VRVEPGGKDRVRGFPGGQHACRQRQGKEEGGQMSAPGSESVDAGGQMGTK
jgi:hypothetical protein